MSYMNWDADVAHYCRAVIQEYLSEARKNDKHWRRTSSMGRRSLVPTLRDLIDVSRYFSAPPEVQRACVPVVTDWHRQFVLDCVLKRIFAWQVAYELNIMEETLWRFFGQIIKHRRELRLLQYYARMRHAALNPGQDPAFEAETYAHSPASS